MKTIKKLLGYMPHTGILFLLLTEYYAPENIHSYFKSYLFLYMALIGVIYLINLLFNDKKLDRILLECIYLAALIISLSHDSEVPALRGMVIAYPIVRMIQLGRKQTE